MNSLDISLRNDPAELKRLAGILEEFGRQHRLGPRDVLALDLSLHEHLTNIINYGYDDTKPREIQIRLRLRDRLLHLEVEDDARPFNPLERAPVDTTVPLDQKPIGGLGIHIMRRSMDALEYRRDGARNILTMRKRIA